MLKLNTSSGFQMLISPTKKHIINILYIQSHSGEMPLWASKRRVLDKDRGERKQPLKHGQILFLSMGRSEKQQDS